jgi:hypothetical protein
MSQPNELTRDEDLTPHFHWRWGEHGIYLAVCSIIGLFVLGLHLLPRPPKRPVCLGVFEFIQVHDLTAADVPPEPDGPFRDTRLIRPRRNQTPERLIRHTM